MIRAFPKVFAIHKDYVKGVLDGPVEITEKVDGSMFAFALLDNILYTRSKGQMIYPETCPKIFRGAVDHVLSIRDKIPPDIIFYCETLQGERQATITYGRAPKNHLILFAACSAGYTFESNYGNLVNYALTLDIEVVPLLYKGTVVGPETDRRYYDDFVEELLGKESILGGTRVEGIVIKNYAKEFLLGGQEIPLMCAKVVSEEFKEQHRGTWKSRNTGKGKWETYKESFRTEARWMKAIQHLREGDALTCTPRDIGFLIHRVRDDITAEEKEAVKEFLWGVYGEELLRKSTAGLPEWYKERLASNELTRGD